MDAFEQIVADLLRAEGWWGTTNFTIQLNEAQRVLFNMKNARPFEFDIVDYRGHTNTLMVVECRSYMYSKGVQTKEVTGEGGAYMSLSVPIIEANHLSYQTSQETAREFGRQTAAAMLHSRR